MTKYCLQDVPQQDSSYAWLQRSCLPSLWELGPGALVSSVVLVTGISIIILFFKGICVRLVFGIEKREREERQKGWTYASVESYEKLSERAIRFS